MKNLSKVTETMGVVSVDIFLAFYLTKPPHLAKPLKMFVQCAELNIRIKKNMLSNPR